MTENKELKILIVDDDPDWLFFLKDLLDLAYIDVVTAKNGEEGLKIFDELKPDLVITDTNMPQLDGVELLRQIRLQSATTPVLVFFTDSTKGYTRESIFKEGATAVFQKTETGVELLKLLKNIKWKF